jgi:phytoene dehydrogenase-like protein
MSHYDTILIGAGMSGLAAGIRLAQFDQRVVVLERHYLWGGLNSFYKRGGRRFDVGLHALTNYAAKGERGLPLTRMLRQLRIRHEELHLGEQRFSEIAFPDTRLRFTNEFELFESEVAREFPTQMDGFARLVREVREADAFTPDDTSLGARAVLATHFDEPLLIEALMLPMCYYGSARVDDIDWYQFVILFRSFFFEGFSRPEGGIQPMLELLRKRYLELGGELRLRCGVQAILSANGKLSGVRLDDGTELTADRVLSSAGYVETMRLAGREDEVQDAERGDMSFTETIFVMDTEPAKHDHGAAVIFFNDTPDFRYRVPDDLIDTRSGVICSPNNYASEAPLPEGILRYTNLANYERWNALEGDAYEAAKREQTDAALAVATRYGMDPRPHEVFRDSFTPTTVRRFTGHDKGAVYGSPTKRLDGATTIDGLHLMGTDQGMLGVVGAILSGISMANRHALVTR